MDIDDDRYLNIDSSDGRKLNSFKVPKKNLITKSSFDKLPLDSSEFKDNIFPKVLSGFKNPNSYSSYKVLSAYNICNVEVESLFNKRKQFFKKEYSTQSAVEYFGFIYVSTLSELRKIVQQGRVKNGNLRESVLGQAEMGVSVSQYADIYNPGENKTCPRSGFLLIVKYIRGRVCFVVEDDTPMEPQPNYDCHMSKLYSHESFPSMGRAFHTTQVYLYEYSDDLDLLDEPSHVLPWGAVEFVWSGAMLYKLVSVPIVASRDSSESSNRDPASKTVDKRIRLLARTTGCPSQRIKQSYTDCTPILCTQLQLKLSTKDDSSENAALDIPVTILSYHSYWSSFASLMMSSWQICELMEWVSFEQEFLKPLMKNQANENFSLNDVFNKRVTISRSSENEIRAFSSTDSSTSGECKYVNYLRLVVNDPSRDRAKMARLIDHFLETKTVGRVRLYDSSSSLLFLFPDSTLSINFGIPAVKTLDVNYLHVLLVTNKSLNYSSCTDLCDEALEIDHRTKMQRLCALQIAPMPEALLPLFVVRQSLRNQNQVQKAKLREMCGGSVAAVAQKFESINFDYSEEAGDVAMPADVIDAGNNNGLENGAGSKDDHGDRPYDPTENLMGLSDKGSSRKTSLATVRRPVGPDQEEPPAKVLKREDKKMELNNKLLELFAKIESPVETVVVPPPAPLLETPPPVMPDYHDDQPYQYGRSAATFSKSLDRNRFQTQFRHGVSVYVPQGEAAPPMDEGPPRDRDLRMPLDPPAQNQSFFYSDGAGMRHKGLHR